MRGVIIVGLAVLLVGCSGNNETMTDMGSGGGGDMAVATDTGSTGEDTGSDGTTDTGTTSDGGNGENDSGSSTDAGGSEDTGASADAGSDASSTDTGGDPYAGRPTGQCTENADCPDGPNGSNCSTALPGGACLGCGNDSHCPGDAVCSQFGACITECDVDDDCPPGLDCSVAGRCAATDCVNGTCPVPLFGCSDSDRCERIDCSSDPNVCPADTTCIEDRCIEDRSLNP